MREIREAWRGLKRTPGASAAALVTLAIGLGISFAIFNLLYAALWQPLPYPHSGELVSLSQTLGTLKGVDVSPPEMQALAAGSTTLSGVGVYRETMGVITGHGPAKSVSPVQIDPHLFVILGLLPSRGRAFTPADTAPGAAPVMIVSAAFAHERFGSASVLGQTLSFDGVRHRIVGVVPAAFSQFLGAGQTVGIFLPLAHPVKPAWGAVMYSAIGRLRPNATLGAANAEAAAVSQRLAQAREFSAKAKLSAVSLADSLHDLGSTPWLLGGAAMLILLLACVNVTSLLLARVTARRQELAIRHALGAERGRLMELILLEGLGLGLCGGLLAWWVGWALVHLLTAAKPPYAWMLAAGHRELAPLAFAVVVSTAVGLLCSVIPAWRVARGLAAPVQQAAAPRRLRGGVIALEVALALVLAVSAALLIRTVEHLQAVPVGFNPDHVLTAEVLLPQKQFTTAVSPASQLFFDELLERARALPGVRSAALASALPMDGGMYTSAKLHGKQQPLQIAMISNGYFATLGIALLRGRHFALTDMEHAPRVAIVNQALAASWWPDRNPIGQSFSLGDPKHAGPWTVIGVAHDTHQRGYIQLPARFEPRGMAYFPRAQYPNAGYQIALRTSGDPAALSAPLRRLVTAMSPDAVYTPEPMTGLLGDSIVRQTFLKLLLELAAALALALAVIGIYGTVSYWVSQRTQEMGVRMALGSSAGGVQRLVLGRTLRWAIAGAVVGGFAAWAAARGLASILFQVTPADPASIATGVALLLLAAFAAAWLPARHAARVDPAEALRHE
ncbi:MAG: ADOP family duplicated permease [Terriglobales bacterium]